MPLRMLLTTLFLLQAIAAFLTGPALWGIHHLAYTPLPVRLAERLEQRGLKLPEYILSWYHSVTQ